MMGLFKTLSTLLVPRLQLLQRSFCRGLLPLGGSTNYEVKNLKLADVLEARW